MREIGGHSAGCDERVARRAVVAVRADGQQVIGTAVEHSIEDPFTGAITVRFRLP